MKRMYSPSRPGSHSLQKGISLVETMIGMALGLVASFIIVQSFSSSEAYRRNIGGSGDAIQTAAIAGGHLDMVLQEAGGSLVLGRHVWSCKLLVSRGSSAVIPRGSAYPDPFASFPTTIRVLPIGVMDGGTGSDVIMVMTGNSGSGNRDAPFKISGSNLSVTNSNGIGLTSVGKTPNDLFLAVPQDVPGGPGSCQIVQAQSTFAVGAAVTDPSLGLKVMPANVVTTIPLNTATYGLLTTMTDLDSPSIFHLGRESSPIFSLISVNANGELVEYDLLERVNAQTFGENIFLLKVRYGLDNGNAGGVANDNVIDEWVSPGTSGWQISNLMDGTASIEQKVDQIKAIRIAMVTRSSQAVTTDAKTTQLVLFPDLSSSLQVTRSLSSDEQKYQYQVFDWVIPLRNMKATPKA